jgi:L-2-hydroxyglutarate oxidase LhgO
MAKKLEERTFNTVAVVACVRLREIARIPGCGLVEGSPSLCEITDSGQPMENAIIEHLVIGAGVIGLSVAAALARGGEQVFVVEAASRIGCGISSRNSEIVHSGIYYETGSLKHRLCVDGRRLLYDYCRSHRIAHRKCGKLIVAANEVEADQIVGLAKRAQQNQIERVDLIDAQAAKRLEPNLRATLALHVCETGLVDSHGLMLSLLSEIEEAGGAILLNHRVLGGGKKGARGFDVEVAAPDGALHISTRSLVIAAGPWAHAVAAAIDDVASLPRPRLLLVKGTYFAHSARARFSRLIYPIPEPGGLGVHLTLDLAGNMRFGPDVEWLETCDPDKVDFTVDPERSARFYPAVRRYWPELADGALYAAYAGVRPKLSGPMCPNSDFLIRGPHDHGVEGLVELYGIESPGLTSSLAIGEFVKSMLDRP